MPCHRLSFPNGRQHCVDPRFDDRGDPRVTVTAGRWSWQLDLLAANRFTPHLTSSPASSRAMLKRGGDRRDHLPSQSDRICSGRRRSWSTLVGAPWKAWLSSAVGPQPAAILVRISITRTPIASNRTTMAKGISPDSSNSSSHSSSTAAVDLILGLGARASGEVGGPPAGKGPVFAN